MLMTTATTTMMTYDFSIANHRSQRSLLVSRRDRQLECWPDGASALLRRTAGPFQNGDQGPERELHQGGAERNHERPQQRSQEGYALGILNSKTVCSWHHHHYHQRRYTVFRKKDSESNCNIWGRFFNNKKLKGLFQTLLKAWPNSAYIF